MGSFVLFVLALAFLNIVCGAPAWEYDEDTGAILSSPKVTRHRCSCSNDDHQCGCCLHIKAHPFQKPIDADVCINATYVPSPLGMEFFMTWNKSVVFNKTISIAEPPPICFGIPHMKFAKACVKFSKVSIEKGHTGGCVALKFKTPHTETEIPLGCFFYGREEGKSLDKETFLDSDPLMLRLEDLFRDAMEDQLERTNSLVHTPYKDGVDDDITDIVTVDKVYCQCTKEPSQCDCCAEYEVIGFPVKACVHADFDHSGKGFNVTVIINGVTLVKTRISVLDPPPICSTIVIFHRPLNVCLKFTHVSLDPGRMGACAELYINSAGLPLGCFYKDLEVTKEWIA